MCVGVICLLAGQYHPGDPGQLVGKGHRDEPEWLLLAELPDPVGHRRWLVLNVAHDGCGPNDEQPSQVPVTLLRDAAEPSLAARRVLLRCQTKPRGELPAGSELIRIGDGGGDGCCRDDAKPRYRGKPSTGLTRGMPGDQLLVERGDLAVDRHDLADQYLDLVAREER